MTRIDKIEVYWGKVPVKCKFSFGSVEKFPFMLVKLVSDNYFGWGEMLIMQPNDFFFDFAQTLIRTEPDQMDDILEKRLDIESEEQMYFAEPLSMASYCLLSNQKSLPINRILGDTKRKKVPLMPCIFPESPEDGAKKALHFLKQGFKFLKVKLIGQPVRDIETVKKIKNTYSDNFVLQGDANLGYAVKDIESGVLERLCESGLDVIEDPFEGDGQKYLDSKKENHPKLMIDIYARKNKKLEEFLKIKAVDYVNLHPCQQGTIKNAIHRYKLCKSYGIPAVVGGTGFTGVGTLFYQYLSTVIGETYACGELSGNFDHGMPKQFCDMFDINNGCIEINDILKTPDPDLKNLSDFLEGHKIIS